VAHVKRVHILGDGLLGRLRGGGFRHRFEAQARDARPNEDRGMRARRSARRARGGVRRAVGVRREVGSADDETAVARAECAHVRAACVARRRVRAAARENRPPLLSELPAAGKIAASIVVSNSAVATRPLSLFVRTGARRGRSSLGRPLLLGDDRCEHPTVSGVREPHSHRARVDSPRAVVRFLATTATHRARRARRYALASRTLGRPRTGIFERGAFALFFSTIDRRTKVRSPRDPRGDHRGLAAPRPRSDLPRRLRRGPPVPAGPDDVARRRSWTTRGRAASSRVDSRPPLIRSRATKAFASR
jgi:hypothetical protein